MPSFFQRVAESEKQRPPEMSEYDVAVDHLERRVLVDVECTLRETFAESQTAKKRQQMRAVVLSLVERFVAEKATLYNRPVKYELRDESGALNEEATARLADAHHRSGYALAMQQLERYEALLDSCGLWAQVKRDKPRFVPVLPQRIVPVQPEDLSAFDPLDQDDFEAWEVSLGGDRRALLEAKSVSYYERRSGASDVTNLRKQAHGFERVPFVVVSAKPASDFVLPGSDIPVVRGVRDLCVLLSSVFDTIRFQGFAIPVITATDKSTIETNKPVGVRFPLALNAGDKIEFVSPNVPYDQLIGVVRAYLALLAVGERSSPAEFSLEGAAAQSGFAKIVDSMPKMEARSERESRYRLIEEQRLWPVVGEVYAETGFIYAADAALRLSVTYSKVEVPESAQERVQVEQHEITTGITTAAGILAKRTGLSQQEAEEQVKSNLAAAKPEQPQKARGGIGDSLGAVVAGRRRG